MLATIEQKNLENLHVTYGSIQFPLRGDVCPSIWERMQTMGRGIMPLRTLFCT